MNESACHSLCLSSAGCMVTVRIEYLDRLPIGYVVSDGMPFPCVLIPLLIMSQPTVHMCRVCMSDFDLVFFLILITLQFMISLCNPNKFSIACQSLVCNCSCACFFIVLLKVSVNLTHVYSKHVRETLVIYTNQMRNLKEKRRKNNPKDARGKSSFIYGNIVGQIDYDNELQ